MTKLSCCVVRLVIVLSAGQYAESAPVFYVANPSGNSVDWRNAVTGLGVFVNSNVNFETHPPGAVQSNFYFGSDGVTITSNSHNGIVLGGGPGGTNVINAQPGEGVYAYSNYLESRTASSPTTTTISFESAVIGAGLYTIDYFGDSVMTLHAYDGLDGMGNLLGSATAVNQNFQRNNFYFMGVSDSSNVIRSIALLTHDGAERSGDVIGLDDIRFTVTSKPPIPSDTLYVVNNSGPSSLYTIDATTGIASLVGATGFSRLTDIAFAPDSSLYGIDSTGFLTLDPSTGAGSFVGNIGFGGLNALAVQPNTGRVYAGGSNFMEIDPATGQGTLIRNYHGGFGISGDLAFSPDGSTLYATIDGISGTDRLVTVNLTTGRLTLIGDIGYDDVFGLSFTSDGSLFGADRLGTLLTIDSATGAGSRILGNRLSYYGLTTSPIPEPSTLALFLLNLIWLGLYRQRIR